MQNCDATQNRDGIIIGLIGYAPSAINHLSTILVNSAQKLLPRWCQISLVHENEVPPSGVTQSNQAQGDYLDDFRNKNDVSFIQLNCPDNKPTLSNCQGDAPKEKTPILTHWAKCDVFILFHDSSQPDSRQTLTNILHNQRLEKRILAYIHEAPGGRKYLCKQDNNGIFTATIPELPKSPHDISDDDGYQECLSPLIRFLSYQNVFHSAQGATAKSFLTSNKGTRYGAAVRSISTGKVFSAGQYSSFNHSTNIHAEMGALFLAAMAGEPDVDVLAIACSNTEAAIPCGVCRQVMLEHSQRTKRDFDVLMGNTHNSWPILQKVSELLPAAWEAHASADSTSDVRKHSISPEDFPNKHGQIGDYCFFLQQQQELLTLVWDDKFLTGKTYLKAKYEHQRAGWKKLPHAFTGATSYQNYLIKQKLASDKIPGAIIAESTDCVAFLPKIHLDALLKDREILITLQNEIFDPANIDLTHDVFLTNSRLLGIHNENSDYDLLVTANPSSIKKLRQIVSKLLLEGRLQLQEDSQSWKTIKEVFPNGTKDNGQNILAEERYCETFSLQGMRFSILYSQHDFDTKYAFEDNLQVLGRKTVAGTIINDTLAPYKRSETILRADNGTLYRILCYHKIGNLLKKGDKVAAWGWLVEDNPTNMFHSTALTQDIPHQRKTILLTTFSTDKIVWFK